MIKLSTEVQMAIKQSKILFCDCFAFMVLPPDLIVSALEYATEVGRSIFFDPGPRGKLLANGTPAEKKALDKLLTMSSVILLTSDEVNYTLCLCQLVCDFVLINKIIAVDSVKHKNGKSCL